jgi:hypothetical protein
MCQSQSLRPVGIGEGSRTLTLLHEQPLQHGLDRVRGPEHALDPRPAATPADDGEVTRPRLAAAALLEQQRDTGREVRLADEQLAPPRDLDNYVACDAVLSRV